MDSNDVLSSMSVKMGIVLALATLVWLVIRLRGALVVPSDLNRTDDWTPGPDDHPKVPAFTILTPYDLQLVTGYLGPGETLEGFGRGFFDPLRREDWRFESGVAKLPLLVAATSRRMLMFKLTLLDVHGTCFVPYEDIESIVPPKPGVFGTSGRMKVRLRSGREYRFGFVGPLMNPEAMEQEQRMAECFRRVAVRIGTQSGSGASYTRAA
jgi:hypothetical protein